MKYNRQKFCDMTNEEKLDLIKQELDLETHNATTKDDLLMIADWLYWRVVKGDLKPNKVAKGNKKVKEEVWSWNKDCDGYWENGAFDTREEAIREALTIAQEEGLKEFYVGRCELIPIDTTIDSEDIFWQLDERYGDESGCEDYLYENVSEEDSKWLEDKMQEVIEEFHKRAGIEANWFNVVDTELIKVDEIIN